MPKTKRLVWMLKLAIGLALIAALLLWDDNGRKLLRELGNIQPALLALAFLITITQDVVSSYRWSLFVRARDVGITQLMLFRYYLIGRFFNNFAPSMFGGDVVRMYLLGRNAKSYSVSGASVILERASGLIGLVLTALVFFAFNSRLVGNPIITLSIAGTVLCCAIFIVSMVTSFSLERIIESWPLPGFVAKLARKFDSMMTEIRVFRYQRRVLFKSVAYSVVFQVLGGLLVYTVARSIGFEPPLLDVMVITPVIMFLSMIPVSPNNVGWWEWCFSVLLLEAGGTAAQGLAVALLIRALMILLSIIGGVLFLLDRPPLDSDALAKVDESLPDLPPAAS
ncbi:MAG: YbhN family protein [Geminicoccaceae bacterium]